MRRRMEMTTAVAHVKNKALVVGLIDRMPLICNVPSEHKLISRKGRPITFQIPGNDRP
jgi:hypothetical protein